MSTMYSHRSTLLQETSLISFLHRCSISLLFWLFPSTLLLLGQGHLDKFVRDRILSVGKISEEQGHYEVIKHWRFELVVCWVSQPWDEWHYIRLEPLSALLTHSMCYFATKTASAVMHLCYIPLSVPSGWSSWGSGKALCSPSSHRSRLPAL